MMKILILQDDFPPRSLGGAGIVAYNLAKSFIASGHAVSVITCVQDVDTVGVIEYDGLKVYRIFSKYNDRYRAYISLYNPQTIKKVAKILEIEKPEIVHAHNIHLHLSYHCLKLSKSAGAKVILTAHDAMLYHYGKASGSKKVSEFELFKKFKRRYNPFRNLAIKYYLRYVNKIIAVSSALRNALIANGINNTVVIHNGIDVSEWDIDEKYIEEFKIKHNLLNRKVILFGGRLSEAKGGFQAIMALREVAVRFPNTILLIIGHKNEYAEKMLSMARRSRLGNNIIFTGWISGNELKAAYQASDIVWVLSIYIDPFPTVNLEAMACKKPVIATCHGGTQEIVMNNQTGYIINPLDIEDISSKTLNLLLDSGKSEIFGTAGYNRVVSNFSIDIQVQKILEKYKHE